MMEKKILKKLVMDQFCFRQFDASSNALFINYPMEDFLEKVNIVYDPNNLKNGYAPFCKHLFIHNFTSAKISTVKITEENSHLIKTSYEARTEKELPVLRRFIPNNLIETN